MRGLHWLKRPPRNFSTEFSRELLAEVLWEYGEDELAEAALRLSDRQLRSVQRLDAWHHHHDREPKDGPRLTNGRIMARAMIDYACWWPRDTRRTRRRTRPQSERYDADPSL